MANIFRADHIGTLVKPQALLTAEESSKHDPAALRAAQDAAIREALDLQKAVVMTVVTDGEFRRAGADEPYVSAISGLEPGNGAAGALRSAYGVSAPLGATRRLVADEVQFIKATTRARNKVCLLAPSALAVRFYRPGVTERIYPSVAELAAAFSAILKAEIEALIGEKIDYIQLNAPAYDALYENAGQLAPAVPGLASASAFEELVAVDAALLQSITSRGTSTLAVHVGRAAGADQSGDRYERLVARLWGALPATDRLLLEYGEPAAHDFQGLKALPAGKMAALGLVRTEGVPEEIGAIIGRIEAAARQCAEEQLALTPRKGFTNAGQAADEARAAQKRTLVRASEVVQQFWGLEL